MIALRHLLPMAFVDDTDVIAMAGQGLTVLAFVSVFTGIDRCLVNAMRGAGKSVVPMITAQFGAFSRIPLAYFLAVRTGDYMGIFYAMMLASLIRMLAIAFYYFGGGWKRAVKGFLEKHEREEAARAQACACDPAVPR
jgi:Na+-driven multidrug efflux pump